MQDHFIHIKEVALKNNCPVCFNNDGLYLSFKQRIVNTKFYNSITREIKHELACKTCNSPIYPVQWTDDIEQVFEYHKKAFTPKKATVKLKTASWILIATLLLILVSIISLMLYQKL
ncbi:hypothetical protein [Aestuariivivens insulae]|uniref:hypothetical protein n=1 Tax=Aestuariivivens insulae TaxID=1621988 RepID=UPI001F5AE778|nr:hypothetical protein [Aestuariivivens insulae]